MARILATPDGFGEVVLGYKFYPKQKAFLRACQREGCKVSLAAANGAGKTSRCLNTLVLWHQYMWPSGKTKVTSGSYPQIEDQIWPAIEIHKEKFPMYKWLETPYFTSIHPRTKIEGFFRGFTTNHPGRAEGDHPDNMESDIPSEIRPLMFIVDEAKTAPLWLRGVIEGRVRPTRLILMSSHGFSEGWFYETQRILEGWQRFNISADDCPHITKEEIDEVKKAWAGNPEFADSVLGYDFMPLVEDAIINGRALDECIANPPPRNQTGEIHAGCDFAWGGAGALNVLALRRGNIVTIEKKFHCGHLISSPKNLKPGIAEQFVQEFQRLGLTPSQISGDEGGGGKLVCDELDRLGWPINRINNGASANDCEHYANTGAEMWYEFGRMVTLKSLVLPHDRDMRGQLLNRKRKINDKGKLAVESKDDMKLRGVPSPDIGDAVCICSSPRGGYVSGAVSWAMPIGAGHYQALQY